MPLNVLTSLTFFFFFLNSDFPSRIFCDLLMKAYLGQLLFGTATFFGGYRIKLSKKELFFEAGTSAQRQLFQKSYILEKANLSEKQYSALPTFSGELPF